MLRQYNRALPSTATEPEPVPRRIWDLRPDKQIPPEARLTDLVIFDNGLYQLRGNYGNRARFSLWFMAPVEPALTAAIFYNGGKANG